jgi:hypothetical protein
VVGLGVIALKLLLFLGLEFTRWSSYWSSAESKATAFSPFSFRLRSLVCATEGLQLDLVLSAGFCVRC